MPIWLGDLAPWVEDPLEDALELEFNGLRLKMRLARLALKFSIPFS
jgi:hypothetical protein